MPTRLFDALTMPVIPVVPLPHVTAPASVAAALSQNKVATTQFPFDNAVTLAVPDVVAAGGADKAVGCGDRAGNTGGAVAPGHHINRGGAVAG